jgi:hypothetical protein
VRNESAPIHETGAPGIRDHVQLDCADDDLRNQVWRAPNHQNTVKIVTENVEEFLSWGPLKAPRTIERIKRGLRKYFKAMPTKQKPKKARAEAVCAADEIPTTNPVNRLKPATASNQALADAVTYATEYGRVKQIAEAMSRLTGESVTRQMVGRWLAEDPAKRQQPSLGNGLLLLLVVQRLMHGDRFATHSLDGPPVIAWEVGAVIHAPLKTKKTSNDKTR